MGERKLCLPRPSLALGDVPTRPLAAATFACDIDLGAKEEAVGLAAVPTIVRPTGVSCKDLGRPG
ncbi:hypothetical protein GCM10009678_74590 [Actinomadura kijaniata]